MFSELFLAFYNSSKNLPKIGFRSNRQYLNTLTHPRPLDKDYIKLFDISTRMVYNLIIYTTEGK